jgi:hypothetical protein
MAVIIGMDPHKRSSATGSHPRTGSSEKPLPEPARTQPKLALPKVS